MPISMYLENVPQKLSKNVKYPENSSKIIAKIIRKIKMSAPSTGAFKNYTIILQVFILVF